MTSKFRLFILTIIISGATMIGCIYLPSNKIYKIDKEVRSIYSMYGLGAAALLKIDFEKKNFSAEHANDNTNGFIGYWENYFYYPVSMSDENGSYFLLKGRHIDSGQIITLETKLRNIDTLFSSVSDGYFYCTDQTKKGINVYKIEGQALVLFYQYQAGSKADYTAMVKGQFLVYAHFDQGNESFLVNIKTGAKELLSENTEHLFVYGNLVYIYDKQADLIRIYDTDRMSFIKELLTFNFSKSYYKKNRSRKILAIHNNKLYFVTQHVKPQPGVMIGIAAKVFHSMNLDTLSIETLASIRTPANHYAIIFKN